MPARFSRTVWSALAAALVVAACAPPAAPAATPTFTAAAPGPTAAPLVTPTASAVPPTAPAAPTPIRVPPGETRLVNFLAADGAALTGELAGAGETAVIFSVMGNCRPGWTEVARAAAAAGLRTLTYQWRACRGSAVDEETIRQFAADARGALAFVRVQGATRIILAGASLGGMASAMLATEPDVVALLVMAAPEAIPQWGVRLTAAELDTAIPKLFITAEQDRSVPPSASRKLFELAAEPKEWQLYPGAAHGTDLFAAEDGAAVQERVLAFLLANAGGP